MTISSTSRQAGPYAGNGVTVALPFAFKVFATTDVRVVSTNPAGVSSDMALGTQFNVSLNSDQDVSPGGTVTMIVAPAVGYSTTITSKVPALQSLDLTSGGNFYPQSIENALDKVTVLVQQALIDVETAALANPAEWSSSLGAADGSKLVGFVQPDSGAVQRSVLQKLRDKVSSADFNTYVASSDNTGALQAAINAIEARVATGNSNGGVIEIPPGTHTFLGSLLINNSFISLAGSGTQSTLLNFANGALDCFVINGSTAPGGNLRDVWINDMTISGNGLKSAGASVKISNAFRCGMERVSIDNCITGIDVGGNTNSITLRDVMINPNQGASLYGIYWHCPGDGSLRSDALEVYNVVVDANWSNADCFVWDGFCNTLAGSGLRLLHGRYCMRVLNSAASALYYPAFCNLHDAEFEGAKNRALDIRGGNEIKITDFDINNLSGGTSQGNADDYAIYIDSDLAHSITRGVQLTNGRVGLCRSNAIYSDSKDLQMANVTCISASYAGANTAAAVRLGSNSSDVQIANLIAEEFGGTGRCSYAVQIDSGAARIQGSNVSALYCNTGHILNNSSGQVGFYNVINPSGNLVPYVGVLLPNYVNDAAAAAGGVAIGGWYRNGSIQMQRTV